MLHECLGDEKTPFKLDGSGQRHNLFGGVQNPRGVPVPLGCSQG